MFDVDQMHLKIRYGIEVAIMTVGHYPLMRFLKIIPAIAFDERSLSEKKKKLKRKRAGSWNVWTKLFGMLV
jgi:hypothetical protein